MRTFMYEPKFPILLLYFVLSCVCQSDHCENNSVCIDHADDEIAALQVFLSSSKIAATLDNDVLAESKKDNLSRDVPVHIQDEEKEDVRMPSNASVALFSNSTQREELKVTRKLSAAPEKLSETKLQPQAQELGLEFMEFTSIRHTRHLIGALMSSTQTIYDQGKYWVTAVLAVALATILVILVQGRPLPSKSVEQRSNVDLRWYHLTLFVAITMIGPMSTDCIAPALRDIQQGLQVSPRLVSMSMPMNVGIRALSMIAAGILSDRFGQKKMLMISLVLFVGGTIVCMCSTGIWTYLIGRFVQGMGEASDAIVQAMVRMLVDDVVRRQHILALLTGLQPVAVILAPLGGSMMSNFFGWRSIYALLLYVAAASLVGCAAIMPEISSDSPQLPVFQQFAAVLGKQESVFLLVPFSIQFGVLFSSLCNISFILAGFGLSTIHIGLFMASMPPFVALGAVTCDRAFVGDGKHLFKTLCLAMCFECVILLSTFYTAMLCAGSLWAIMIAFYSIAFGLGMCVPTFVTLYLEPLRGHAGLASGVMTASQNILSAGLAPITVLALEEHGIRSMFLAFMAIHLFGQAIFWIGYRINRQTWLATNEPDIGKEHDGPFETTLSPRSQPPPNVPDRSNHGESPGTQPLN